MAAYIPVKNDPEANERGAEQGAGRQRTGSERRARRHVGGPSGTGAGGHGSVRRAHADAEPDRRKAEDVHVTAEDLLEVPEGSDHRRGFADQCQCRVQYIEAWIRGIGCVPINNLMEDAATAEISRAQVWQWIRHPEGKLEDGRKVTVGTVPAGAAGRNGKHPATRLATTPSGRGGTKMRPNCSTSLVTQERVRGIFDVAGL